VEVPELPGSKADGATRQEAIAIAEIVIQEWTETAQSLGRPVPEPHSALLCTPQTAERLGLDKAMVRCYSVLGRLPARKTGKGWAIQRRDYTPTEAPMVRSYVKINLVAWMLLFAAFVTSCTSAGEKHSYLTVDEVWQKADSLNGKQVQVRGYPFFQKTQTLVLCEPQRCNCNESQGELILVGEELQPENFGKILDLPTISIASSSLKCKGDECTMKCTPFDPTVAREFELVGTLKMEHDDLFLDDLDLAASRQRIDQEWLPIETGTFTVSGKSTPSQTQSPTPTLSPDQLTAMELPADAWISHGPDGRGITALVVDPATPTTLYAASNGTGVFKSSDGGRSWIEVNSGLTNSDVLALVIDPHSPATLYAGTLDGVFKTTDGGENWSTASTGLTRLYVQALAIDPLTPSILYAGIENGGVFKTSNGGESWIAVNEGIREPFCTALAINPEGVIVYAGCGDGIYQSTDGGESWRETSNGLTTYFVAVLEIDLKTPSTLYAGGKGAFKSMDNGESWSEISVGLPDAAVRALAIDPQQLITLYAGTGMGVYQSTDGGASWRAFGEKSENAIVLALAIDPTLPTTLYAGTVGGEVYAIHP
jgi:photosystem II stability/assembly factor-like uncharacterized protein